MKLGELVQRSGAIVVGAPGTRADQCEISAVTQDSRHVGPGTLFAALRGGNVDGRKFIPDAVARGASAILSDRNENLPPSVALVVATKPRTAFGKICAAFHGHPAHSLDVMGITGTNGKTTTSYLIQQIFQRADRPCGRLGTVSNDFGTGDEPADYTTLPAEELQAAFAKMRDNRCHAASIEVSSQALHQGRAAGVEFAAGIFCNLTQDHLDYHGTMDEYGACKATLFSQIRPNGVAIINGDDDAAGRMIRASRCAVKTFGLGRHNLYRGVAVKVGAAGSRFMVFYPGGKTEIASPLVGEFNVRNLLGAFATAHAMGLDPEQIAETLESATGAPGRLQRVTAPSAETVPIHAFVDYAHTPDALEKVLTALDDAVPHGELTVVFGCGGDRDRTKRPKMAAAAAALADRIFVTSDNPRTEDPTKILDDVMAGFSADDLDRVSCIVDRQAAIFTAVRDMAPGDTLLVAGKGHEDYQIIGREKFHFDDREVLRDALAAWPQTRIRHITRRMAG